MDVDVLNHIAEDYIPVVASVGADAEGQSYNVNADAAAGAVAAAMGAFKVVFLTDVRGLAGRSRATPAAASREATADGGPRSSSAASAAACGPKLEACVDAVEGGVRRRAHHRRPPAALAAARAVHRRGHRNEDVAP